jgi:hypothetical protein
VTREIQCGDCGQTRPVFARELCKRCYQRRWHRQRWTGPGPQPRPYRLTGPCLDCGAVGLRLARGRCKRCYQRGLLSGTYTDLRPGRACRACGQPDPPYLHAGDLCNPCYQRSRRLARMRALAGPDA